MIPVSEFQKENQEIMELCDVLDVLVQQESLRLNPILCDLLDTLMERIEKHISHEDRLVYGDLLAQHTDEADKLASHFLGNTQELKRICKQYKKEWCTPSHSHPEERHPQYVSDSMDIFRLIRERIDFETQKIFPVFQ